MRYSERKPGASLSELDIQAFVDGDVAAPLADRVGRYLGSSPDEAQRVAFYRQLNAQLRTGFPDLAAEQPSDRLEHTLATARWQRMRLFMVVAASLLAACALLAGSLLSGASDKLLVSTGVMALEQVADTERVSASTCNTANPPCPNIAQAAPNLAQTGFRMSAHTTLPLRLLLTAQETVYRNAAGQPAVLLSVPDRGAPDQPQWQARRIGEIRVLSWTRKGMRYMLIGNAGTHGLMKAADLASARR